MGSAKRSILIVEDEKPLLGALENKLLKAGFNVTTALDGKIALDVLQKSKFDLILLDLIMPVMDGFTLLKSVREKGYETPIIVLTNLDQESDIEKVSKYDVKDYLVKSDFSMAGIVERINKVI